MLRSSRRISALPRAVTSRSLTPSIVSASMVVAPVACLPAVCARTGAAATSATASVAKRYGIERRRTFLVRIFNDTRRYAARSPERLAGCAIARRALLSGTRIRGRQFQTLLARAPGGRPQLRRDGRAARQGGLPAVRSRRRPAACRRRARPRDLRAGSRPRLFAARRSRHDPLPRGVDRGQRGAAFRRCHRGAAALAARYPPRRAAALRRSPASSRDESLPRVVYRAAFEN